MKQLIYYCMITMLFFACAKEESIIDSPTDDTKISAKAKGDKVDVCHNGHIINVSINAVSTHQDKHGDAVDMDGDGYFDKDNECGPTDCDDTDASKTDNCCPEECGWCEFDVWDFDEPCDDGNIYEGDYYCNQYISYDYTDCDVNGCPSVGSYNSVYLVDNDQDYQDCDNDTNDENDYGYIIAQWGTQSFNCVDYVWGYVTYYYFNDEGDYIYEDFYEETEAAVAIAQLCAANIVELAEAIGAVNICEDSDYTCTPLKGETSKRATPQQLRKPGQLPSQIQEVLDQIKAN